MVKSRGSWQLLMLAFVCGATPAEGRQVSQIAAKIWGAPGTTDLPAATVVAKFKTLQALGDNQSLPAIPGDLNENERLSWFMLYRAVSLGWLDQLSVPFAGGVPCDGTKIAALTRGLPNLADSQPCPIDELNAADRIYQTLNQPRAPGGQNDAVFQRLFLLEFTAAADLSAVEVQGAVFGDITALPSPGDPHVNPLNWRKRIYKDCCEVERWEDWRSGSPAISKDKIVFFDRQSPDVPAAAYVPSLLAPSKDYKNELAPADTYGRIQILFGDHLHLSGPLGWNGAWSNDLGFGGGPDCPEGLTSGCMGVRPLRRGLRIVANSIEFGHSRAAPWYFGADRSDVEFRPSLVIEGGDLAFVAARHFVLDPSETARNSRIWAKFAPVDWQSGKSQCGLTGQVTRFALKQIGTGNPAVSAMTGFTQLRDVSCLGKSLLYWDRILQAELERSPQNVIQRFVRYRSNAKNFQVAASTNLTQDLEDFVSRESAERWGLARAQRRLRLLRQAIARDDIPLIGSLLHDFEALEEQALVPGTSLTDTGYTAVYKDLEEIRRAYGKRQLFIRGSEISNGDTQVAASSFLASVASRKTWILPTRLRLEPTGPVLGHYWTTGSDTGAPQIHIQFLGRMVADPETEARAAKALAQRGLIYAGVAPDVRFGLPVGQPNGPGTIEAVDMFGRQSLAITIRADGSDNARALLRALNTFGMPLTLSWSSTIDPDVGSDNFAPVAAKLGLSNADGPDLAISDGVVVNPFGFPIALVATRAPDGTVRSLSPSITVGPNGSTHIPSDFLIGNGNRDLTGVHAVTVLDPQQAAPPEQKLGFLTDSQAIVPVTFVNRCAQIGAQHVTSAQIDVSFAGLGGPLPPQLNLELGNPNGLGSQKTVPLVLPAGFTVRYSGRFLLENGMSVPIAEASQPGAVIELVCPPSDVRKRKGRSR